MRNRQSAIRNNGQPAWTDPQFAGWQLLISRHILAVRASPARTFGEVAEWSKAALC